MQKYYVMPDGRVQFIKRGLPPEFLPGYEVDPGDPYMFHPVVEPCAARTFRNMGVAECCPVGRFIRHCSKFSYYNMTPDMCNACVAKGEHVPIELGTTKIDSGESRDKSRST